MVISASSLTSCADIPHPSPADRRDLENLVKTNWDTKVQKPLGNIADQANDQLHHAKEWIFDTYGAHKPDSGSSLIKQIVGPTLN